MMIYLNDVAKANIATLISKKIEERYEGNLSHASRYIGVPRTTIRDVVHNKIVTLKSLQRLIPALFKMAVEKFFEVYHDIIMTSHPSEWSL